MKYKFNNIRCLVLFISGLNLLFPAQACAEAVADQLHQLQVQVQELAQLVKAQQKEIRELKAAKNQVSAVAAIPSNNSLPPSSDRSATTISAAASSVVKGSDFNPEIGVVADMVATSSESDEDEEGNDRLSVREVELVVGHDIDPYSRFDGVFTISDFEDPDIEEAYITHWGLPGIRAKLGRMRNRVNLASMVHRDTLETVDEPLFVQRYLGVEGLFRTGLELSSILPTFWEPVTQEFIIGAMEGGVGEDGELFGSTRRIPSYYARLKNSFDLSEASTLNLGSSFLIGSSDDDDALEARALNLDAQLIHSFNSVQRLKIQTEFMFQDRSAPFLEEEEDAGSITDESETEANEDFLDNPWGTYLLADYRFAQRWSSGMRFDYVEPTDRSFDSIHDGDTAWSAYLTFHQSEFARFRFQYEHVDFAEGENDNRFFLQSTVAIGYHKHALQ